MKVALVAATSSYPTYHTPGEPVDPPLGILGLATLIRDRHQVRIFDGQLFTCSPRRMAEAVLAWQPDVVGFSVNFSTLARASREMAEHVRARAPGVPILFGGNYATFNWERLIGLPYVDYVVMHEAEISFPRLLDHLVDRSRPLPPGLVCKGPDGSYDVRPFAGFVPDLDSLPYCDFDLFDQPASYVKSIVTSRGCPYTCIYCSTREMWQKWRARSPQNVATEMLTLAAKYDTDQVLFADDTFLVNRKRALELCALLQAAGSPVRWGFSTRLETIGEDIIPTLAAAGCRWIFFGCESGSERVLRQMGRFYTRAEILRKIEVCAASGITCTASFILGLPWETESDVRETFRVMEQVMTHRVLLNIFTPLSGTLSLAQPEDYGITFLERPDPERAVVGHGYAGYDTRHLTARQIKDLWLEGQGIVMAKGRQKPALEAQIERNRYGLLGPASPARASGGV